MDKNNNIIKIGVLHNYCCKDNYYQIYHIMENTITNELKILLEKYDNVRDDTTDLMIDNVFYDLFKNNIFEIGGDINMYNLCDYKLYSQDC